MNPSEAHAGASRGGDAAAATSRARWLHPFDDVATALFDLPAGATLHLGAGAAACTVTLTESIRLGHKFAVRELASGMRIRKYGDFIGRTTAAVRAGAWVHEHNLQTAARHHPRDERAWRDATVAAAIDVIGTPRCSVGESPLYDAAQHRLWWVDVRDTPAIHTLALTSGDERSFALREDIGSIALADDGTLLLALRSGFAAFDRHSGAQTALHDPEPTTPRTRLNDGKCDAAGRFWCGSMNPDAAVAEGRLYVFGTDLTCRSVDDGWLTPNGMAFAPDNTTMYVADTRRGLIYAYPFDVASGSVGARRTFADVGAYPGNPDGATVDRKGFLWSVQVDGGCLMRFAPDGALDRVVRLPVSRPTSCVFGGRALRTLFVTTATRGMSVEQRAREPLAGHVLAMDVGVAGLPAATFGGRMAR